MPIKFEVPREIDREIVAALGRLRKSVRQHIELNLAVVMPKAGEVALPENDPENVERLKFIYDAASEVIQSFYVRDPQGRMVADLSRNLGSITDSLTIHDDWANNLPESTRPQIWVSVLSELRKEFKASDLEAALTGRGDTAWNKYRDAQAVVINSLQQTTEALLIKVAERNAQLDKDRDERFAKLEERLRSELEQDRATSQKQIDDQRMDLGLREKALSEREAAFETKEARYVARQKQAEQIKQIQAWLEGWSLTQGTREKRTPTFVAYMAALLITGGLTIWATWHNYSIIKDAKDLTTLQWWHWLGIIVKSFFPLAAFTTFLIYYMRWSGEWARQHAEEEFRHRTRLIDIGRASWLLEAVRDAQERDKEVPPDLLKELSRNLFADKLATDLDVQPQAAADILLQGLSSLRVKSPGGAEVEAKRGK